jgi:hypothetical protein
MIPIDELIEIWVRVHKEVLATYAGDDDLSWWSEACQCLRPAPEDDAILNEESGAQDA